MDVRIEKPQAKHSPEFLALADHDRQLVTDEAIRQVRELAGRQPNLFKTGAEREAQVEEYRRQFASNPQTIEFLRKAHADRQKQKVM